MTMDAYFNIFTIHWYWSLCKTFVLTTGNEFIWTATPKLGLVANFACKVSWKMKNLISFTDIKNYDYLAK